MHLIYGFPDGRLLQNPQLVNSGGVLAWDHASVAIHDRENIRQRDGVCRGDPDPVG
jgi:hypothetical protein